MRHPRLPREQQLSAGDLRHLATVPIIHEFPAGVEAILDAAWCWSAPFSSFLGGFRQVSVGMLARRGLAGRGAAFPGGNSRFGSGSLAAL